MSVAAPRVADNIRSLWYGASTEDKGNFFEFVIEELIKRLCVPGSCAVDVGANYGAHTVTMLQSVGTTGHVSAFEPNPHIASILEKWKDFHENLKIVRTALSDKSGTEEFLIASHAGYGSLYNRPQFNIVVTERLNVATARLDDFPEFRTTSTVSFVKVDVEGSEIAFLRGAKETLRKARPIVVMELDWDFVIPEPCDADRNLFGYLGSIDYAIYDFFGKELKSRDIDAWNILLIPRECDACPIHNICYSAGGSFFRSYRGWHPYKKFEESQSPLNDQKPR